MGSLSWYWCWISFTKKVRLCWSKLSMWSFCFPFCLVSFLSSWCFVVKAISKASSLSSKRARLWTLFATFGDKETPPITPARVSNQRALTLSRGDVCVHKSAKLEIVLLVSRFWKVSTWAARRCLIEVIGTAFIGSEALRHFNLLLSMIKLRLMAAKHSEGLLRCN